jgi:hypothetical protein
MTEDRDQMSEGRGQMTDDRDQMSEGRGQKKEAGRLGSWEVAPTDYNSKIDFLNFSMDENDFSIIKIKIYLT